MTVQATDANSLTSSTMRTYTVYSDSDFDSFGGNALAGYTISNVELRDNYSPASWYSLNATSGSLVVQLLQGSTAPLRQTTPAFPLITRALPTTADFVLQTNFNFETRQFGTYFTGLYADTVEAGVVARYGFGLENGTNLRVWRAPGAAIPNNYDSLGVTPFTGGDLTIRIYRSGAILSFQRRVNGTWTNVATKVMATPITAGNGGEAG